MKGTHLQHIISKRGPLVKDWTEENTTYSLFGIPLATKIKQPFLREIRLFGVPVLKKQLDDSYITLRILGIRVQKRDNIAAMSKRLSARISETERHLNPQANQRAEAEAVDHAKRQFAVLALLAEKRRNRA